MKAKEKAMSLSMAVDFKMGSISEGIDERAYGERANSWSEQEETWLCKADSVIYEYSSHRNALSCLTVARTHRVDNVTT